MENVICSVDGCENPGRRGPWGWCPKHYARWQRHGSPHTVKRPGPAPATRREYIERFWSYVKPVGECWEWQGSTDSNGYGQYSLKTPEKFGFPGRTVKAYAFAWVIENGQVPAGMQLDHLCRNRICVKTAHLEVVTPRENSLRGTSPAAINAVKTHCKHGHLFDSVNTYVDRKGRRGMPDVSSHPSTEPQGVTGP